MRFLRKLWFDAAKSLRKSKTNPGLTDAAKPLYIIDGVLFDGKTILTGNSSLTVPKGGSPFDVLKAEDIESVEALTDAADSPVYGTKAPNGLILITTKFRHG